MTEREFFTGGMETILTALRLKILYILHNPDIKKAHAQKMDPYVAPGRFLSLEDKPKFPFCDEVCKIEMLSQERVKKRAALHPDMS